MIRGTGADGDAGGRDIGPATFSELASDDADPSRRARGEWQATRHRSTGRCDLPCHPSSQPALEPRPQGPIHHPDVNHVRCHARTTRRACRSRRREELHCAMEQLEAYAAKSDMVLAADLADDDDDEPEML